MANSCRSGEADYKKQRAFDTRKKNPNLSYSELAERLGVNERTVERWFSGTGLGAARTEDGRGQRNVLAASAPDRIDSLLYVDAEHDAPALEPGALDDFLEQEPTVRSRNSVVAGLCPESL